MPTLHWPRNRIQVGSIKKAALKIERPVEIPRVFCFMGYILCKGLEYRKLVLETGPISPRPMYPGQPRGLYHQGNDRYSTFVGAVPLEIKLIIQPSQGLEALHPKIGPSLIIVAHNVGCLKKNGQLRIEPIAQVRI